MARPELGPRASPRRSQDCEVPHSGAALHDLVRSDDDFLLGGREVLFCRTTTPFLAACLPCSNRKLAIDSPSGPFWTRRRHARRSRLVSTNCPSIHKIEGHTAIRPPGISRQ